MENNIKPKKVKKPGKGTGLITIESPVNPGSQLIIASEFADDSIIEGEMMGQVLQHFIYEFNQDGKKVTGLSVKGVNEVVRRLNRDPKSGTKIRIRPESQKVERDVEYDGQKGVEVWVFAENLVDGNSGFGTKFEPYKKMGKNGLYANTFALEKALAKAERNAKRKLIPETLATKMIAKLIAADRNSGNAVQQLSPVNYQPISAPARKPVPSTKEEREGAIISWVEKTKSSELLLKGLETLTSNKAYTNEFKQKVSDLISTKVDRLDTEGK